MRARALFVVVSFLCGRLCSYLPLQCFLTGPLVASLGDPGEAQNSTERLSAARGRNFFVGDCPSSDDSFTSLFNLVCTWQHFFARPLLVKYIELFRLECDKRMQFLVCEMWRVVFWDALLACRLFVFMRRPEMISGPEVVHCLPMAHPLQAL